MTAISPDLVDEVIAAEAAAEALAAPDAPSAEAILEGFADPDGAAGLHDHNHEALLQPLEHELELIAGLTPVRALRGVPLFYERGVKPRPQTFQVARTFLPKLETIVDLTRARVPASYGKLVRITSAGMFVAKAGKHGQGRACDWDRLTFERVAIAPLARDHASSDLARRRRYWSFAAICRSVCCFTLHGEYDAAHADHVHCDDSISDAFNTARSTITLLQALLNTVHGASLQVDGAYGPRTRAATVTAVRRLGLEGDVTERSVWIAFLRRSARLGFALTAPKS